MTYWRRTMRGQHNLMASNDERLTNSMVERHGISLSTLLAAKQCINSILVSWFRGHRESLYISINSMKNRHGHRVRWMSTLRRNGFNVKKTHAPNNERSTQSMALSNRTIGRRLRNCGPRIVLRTESVGFTFFTRGHNSKKKESGSCLDFSSDSGMGAFNTNFTRQYNACRMAYFPVNPSMRFLLLAFLL